jgi:hypothetical protein
MQLLWDINEDGDYNDFAAIVVDTRRENPERFGLVIFSAPKNRAGPYRPHWLYRDRDLSRTVMAVASSRLSVESYLDDGSRQACFVRWDRQKQRYFCE